MTRFPALALLCAALGLAACSAPAPIRYHTLLAPASAVPTGQGGGQAQGQAPFLLDVLPVHIPAQLDRSQLVVREGNGGLALPETERWAAPLSDEIRAALSAELARGLNTQDIAGLPRPTGRPIVRVKLQVRRLDAWPGQRVQLEAGWSLGLADGSTARVTCQGRFDEAVASGQAGYAALVQAQQRAIGAMADRIAADVRGVAAATGDRPAACTAVQ